MSIYHHAITPNGEVIFSNLPSDLNNLIRQEHPTTKAFEAIIDGKLQKVRLGFKTNEHGAIYICTNDSRYVNSFKLFKELTNISLISLKSMSDLKFQITEKHNGINEELIHNLTSLNTYSIQDLYALIPQNLLSENIYKQRETIKEIIAKEPNVTSKTLLQLLKYNLAMKVEFSVFQKTLQKNPKVQLLEDSISDVLISILQIFIADFTEKRITVSMDQTDKRLMIDYESLTVSLYYLLDNGIKYCSPNSQFRIKFSESENCFCIIFEMISIKIEDNEIDRLCERFYRSKVACQINTKGGGLGMYRVLKTLKLNNAELQIVPRVGNYETKNGDICYQQNRFVIKFLGQEDWFKRNGIGRN
jgi:light-regulated signal transduction histidine kinase (bacteriophytochrome)